MQNFLLKLPSFNPRFVGELKLQSIHSIIGQVPYFSLQSHRSLIKILNEEFFVSSTYLYTFRVPLIAELFRLRAQDMLPTCYDDPIYDGLVAISKQIRKNNPVHYAAIFQYKLSDQFYDLEYVEKTLHRLVDSGKKTQLLCAIFVVSQWNALLPRNIISKMTNKIKSTSNFSNKHCVVLLYSVLNMINVRFDLGCLSGIFK